MAALILLAPLMAEPLDDLLGEGFRVGQQEPNPSLPDLLSLLWLNRGNSEASIALDLNADANPDAAAERVG
jgi:hypothetical protein